MDKSELDMIKFENKLENLSQPDDTRLLDNEHNFIRKKIDEVRGEINQLENNLLFFSVITSYSIHYTKLYDDILIHLGEYEASILNLIQAAEFYPETAEIEFRLAGLHYTLLETEKGQYHLV